MFALGRWRNAASISSFCFSSWRRNSLTPCRRYFLFSPSLLLQLYSLIPFFAAALFTLFKILSLSSPQCSPSNILSFSLLPLFPVPSPLFSAPQTTPPSSPFPSPPPHPCNSYTSFFPLCLLFCFSSCCKRWQSGRRRWSEAQLAALAPCIIHVPCSLCGSRSSAGFSLGHMGLVKELCVWDTGPAGRAAQMGLSIPQDFCSLSQK